MKTTIAVIGAAGRMGSGIASKLAEAGYRVLLAGKDQSKLADLSIRIREKFSGADIDTLDCSKEASWEADIIILAVPYSKEIEIAEKIKDVVTGKIVVSISNPLNQALDGLTTNPSTSAAEELANYLPYSKVVKAFNTVFAGSFYKNILAGKKIDSFVASDDKEAVSIVSNLVKDTGLNPLPAGNLSVSRTLENMALLLIRLSINNNYNGMAGWKVLHP